MTPPRPFGTLPDGRPVHEYTLTNSHGLRLCVIPYGAIVTQLHVPDRHGQLADVVCGFDNLDQYLAGHPYFGCIAGRVAGRITRGAFTLDGVDYHLAINDPPNHLHGGQAGFDKKLWTVESASSAALRLRLVSADNDANYPGNVLIFATYTVTDANEVRIDYEATADAPTPLSVTHHGYFNLAGAGNGSIRDHQLRIFADTYAPADDAMGLLGRREPVGDNDFRVVRRVGDVIPKLWKQHGDIYFLTSKPAMMGLRIAAELTDPHTGRMMTLWTTEPVVQLYTGKALDGSLIGKSGRPYRQYGALCLEAERYPDGVNTPELGDIILRPGQTYRQTTLHKFTTTA